MSEVILVDEHDHEIGKMDKLKAHQLGVLHRAFSVFLFNNKGELLLQRRALEKYHSGGLWTNTCCSHPKPGEALLTAGKRRLIEELGLTAILEPTHAFVYKAIFDNGLTEYEYDHILIGKYEGTVHPNPEEVMDYKWIGFDELKKLVSEAPQIFTAWFLKIYENTFRNYLTNPRGHSPRL